MREIKYRNRCITRNNNNIKKYIYIHTYTRVHIYIYIYVKISFGERRGRSGWRARRRVGGAAKSATTMSRARCPRFGLRRRGRWRTSERDDGAVRRATPTRRPRPPHAQAVRARLLRRTKPRARAR